MSDSAETRLGGFDGPGRALVHTAFGGGGAVVGVALPFVARWVTDLPWAPFQFQGPFRLVAEYSPGWPFWAVTDIPGSLPEPQVVSTGSSTDVGG